jgi:hypothetical protein
VIVLSSCLRPLFFAHFALACGLLGCSGDDDPTDSTVSAGVGTQTSDVVDTSSTTTTTTDSGMAMEVDCTDAPGESIPVCVPRRDDGTCVDPPDEVELCRKTCIETCCFAVDQIACGPDIAQTDRCCYWILVSEMTCADTLEQTCLPD